MLVIGSTAMQKIFPDFREPKDLDVFARPHPELGFNPEAADSFWHKALEGSVLDRDGYATLDELYTIKVSHAYWDLKNGSWSKHITDIIFMQKAGAKLDMDLHKLLYDIWVEVHGAKKMNLAQAAGNFFDDAVNRIYVHDSIHESVAYGDRPLYELLLKDGESVDMDPKKMWALDHETLVKLFREEIAATALERWMIPTKYKFSPGRAYALALKKTVTSLTKGKSARFLVTNIQDFIKPHDYMTIHKSKMHKLQLLTGSERGMM